MYRVLRFFLFLLPPETVHHVSMNSLNAIASTRPGRFLLRKLFSVNTNSFQTIFAGLTFKNPVGLAAGFDKNALYLQSLETLGFGFIEIGTVTPLAQEGNEKPRLFRLKKDMALINRMGFNNHGADRVAERLKKWKEGKAASGNRSLLIGGNIGKNKATSNENAWKDYAVCFDKLYDWVDYFVVNVSSPNTPGLRELQEKDSLRRILVLLQEQRRKRAVHKPLLLKIAPDLSAGQLDDIIDLALEIQLDGLVVTNTTLSREGLVTPHELVEAIGAGGLSGVPLQVRSTEVVQYIRNRSEGRLPVIGSGGIFNVPDLKEKLEAGAGLVQVWTAFVYKGPSLVKKLLTKEILEQF